MSDFAPLGSLSSLDELGPTEPTWHPFAFRAAQRPQVHSHQQAQQEAALQARVCEPA